MGACIKIEDRQHHMHRLSVPLTSLMAAPHQSKPFKNEDCPSFSLHEMLAWAAWRINDVKRWMIVELDFVWFVMREVWFLMKNTKCVTNVYYFLSYHEGYAYNNRDFYTNIYFDKIYPKNSGQLLHRYWNKFDGRSHCLAMISVHTANYSWIKTLDTWHRGQGRNHVEIGNIDTRTDNDSKWT